MNSPIAQILYQNQTLHGHVAYNWSYGHFVIFLPTLAKKLVAMATSLRPLQSECFRWIGGRRKTPVVSNHILVISGRNALICIYSNFSPKIGCHGNALLSLVYQSVTDEFHDSTNPISKPNSVTHTTEVVAIFVTFLPILAKNWLPWQRPLDPCNQNVFVGLADDEKPLL